MTESQIKLLGSAIMNARAAIDTVAGLFAEFGLKSPEQQDMPHTTPMVEQGVATFMQKTAHLGASRVED